MSFSAVSGFIVDFFVVHLSSSISSARKITRWLEDIKKLFLSSKNNILL